MKLFKIGVFYLFTTTLIIAEPAIFTQREMTIPEGAVITDGSNSYYNGVVSDFTLDVDNSSFN